MNLHRGNPSRKNVFCRKTGKNSFRQRPRAQWLSIESLEDRRLLAVNWTPKPSTFAFDVTGAFSGETIAQIGGQPYRDRFSGTTHQTGSVTYQNHSQGAGTVAGVGSGTGEDNCTAYSFLLSDVNGSFTHIGNRVSRAETSALITYDPPIPPHCFDDRPNPANFAMSGTFSTSTFQSQVKWRQTEQFGVTNGTWTDTITFSALNPYDLRFDSAEWTGDDSFVFSFSTSGPPRRAATNSTPVGHVRFYWVYGDRESDPRTPIDELGSVPIYWNSGGAVVSVTGLPKTATGQSHLGIMLDADQRLTEALEFNNFEALKLVEFKSASAEYDDQAELDAFGTYIIGIPLENKFTVEWTIRGYEYEGLNALSMSYAFAGGPAGMASLVSGQTDTFEFTEDMGELAEQDHGLKLALAYFGRVLGSHDASVKIAHDLDVTISVFYGDGAVDLENLRLIDEVNDLGIWVVEATVHDMPLPEVYGELAMRMEVQSRLASRSSFALDRVGLGVYRTTHNFGQYHDVLEGFDFEFSLKPFVLTGNPKPITIPRTLLVITLPEWLAIASPNPTFDPIERAYDLKIDYQTEADPVAAIDPFGLLNGVSTSGWLSVVAPIPVKPDWTIPVTMELEKFEIGGEFLGKPVGPYSVPTENLSITTGLDNITLDLTGHLSIQMKKRETLDGEITLLDTSGTKKFLLAKHVLDSGLVDTQFDISVRAEGEVGVFAGIELEKSGSRLRVIPTSSGSNGSFVEISAAGGVEASLSAGISAVQIGPCSLASLSGTAELALAVHGTLWTSFSGSIGYVNGSLTGGISANVDWDRSGAAIGAGYFVNVRSDFACGRWEADLATFGPDVVTAQLFGGKDLEAEIENSFESGTGVFSKVNPQDPPADPSPDGSPVAPNSAGSPAGPQGTLEIAAPIPGTVQSITFDAQTFANQAALTSTRHRLDVVLQGPSGGIVLDSWDLAELELSPSDNEIGFESATTIRTIAIPTGALAASGWYSLVFEYYSDNGAGGEIVQVGLDNLDVVDATAVAEFSAPGADLADGQLNFGPDTNAAAETTVTLTNTGGATLDVQRIELVGAAFTIVDGPTGGFVMGPGQSVPVRVRFDAPGVAVSSMLRVLTGDDANATVYTLGLEHDGAASIDIVPPSVSQWLLRSSAWPASQESVSTNVGTIAVGNLDQVVVVFSEGVNVVRDDLAIRGAASPLEVVQFAYDPVAYTAVWTLAAPLAFENVAADLPGGIADAVGLPLTGPKSTSFAVVAGDVDGDNRVGLGDLSRLQQRFGETLEEAEFAAEDVNRDGHINRADLALVARNWGADVADLDSPNRRPQVTPLPPQSGDEGQPLSAIIEATDADAGNTLRFSLVDGPQSAAIDPDTGEFTWTPTVNDGPGEYQFTVRVADDGNPPLSQEMTFTVAVIEPDVPPQLVPITDQSVLQEENLFVAAVATDGNGLTDPIVYSLDAGPAGLSIHAQSGAIIWTPTLLTPAGDHLATVRASSPNNAALFTTTSFTITVEEANYPPQFGAIGELSFAEGEPVEFAVTATDPNPAHTITYSLGDDAPPGATIHPQTGEVSWLPSPTDATGDYVFTVVATDDGTPVLAAATTIRLTIVESNSPPQVAPVADVFAAAGELIALSIVATDLDVPALDLVYSLEPGAPIGASVQDLTGGFTWIVPIFAAGSYPISIRVQDTGPSPVGAFATFTIHVAPEGDPPVVTAMLANDTGTAGDGVTADPTVNGVIVDANAVVLRASVTGEDVEDFVDISSALLGDGRITIDAATWAVLTGGALLDGPHFIHIVAEDAAGNLSQPVSVAFELSATPLSSLIADIAVEHDSLPVGDGETDLPVVDVVGMTDPGMRVLLVGTDIETLADGTGEFRLSDVPLPPGYSNLIIRAENPGGLSLEVSKTIYRTPDTCTPADPSESMACVVTPAFEDIQDDGERLFLTNDDSYWLSPSELIDFEFTFYGVSYDTFVVGSNGLITFEDEYPYWPPSNLTSDPEPATIAALWDNWYYDEYDASGVYWKLAGEAPHRRLIVQWQDALPSLDDPPPVIDPVTFQAVLFEGTNRIQFNYLDLSSDAESNEGGTATVGVKGPGDQETPIAWLAVSVAAGPNALVGSGKSTLITPGEAPPLLEESNPPWVVLGLANDTLYPDDFETSDFTFRGTVNDESPLVRLDLSFSYDDFEFETSDSGTADVLNVLDGDGDFTLASSAWESIFGSAPAEGYYSIFLEAEDMWGNIGFADIGVAFDFTAPSIEPAFDLLPVSDGLPLDDGATPFGRVLLTGFAEPFTEVFVLGQEYETLTQAEEDGQFIIRNVSLSPGENALTVVSRDGAGNGISATDTITFAPTTCLGPDGFGYEACLVAPTFSDISATGQSVPIDGSWTYFELSAAELGDFSFDFYGETHSSFFISPVGGIVLDDIEPTYDHPGHLVVDEPIIAPLWDRLDDYDVFAGSQLNWQVDGTAGERQLIIQWHDLVRWGETTGLTVQAVLHEADGAIEFNYLNVDGEFADPYYFYSTVQGVKGSGPQDPTGNVLYLGAGGINEFSQSGVSVRIELSQAPSPAPMAAEAFAVVAGAAAGERVVDVPRLRSRRSLSDRPLSDQPRLEGAAVDAVAATDAFERSPLRAGRERASAGRGREVAGAGRVDAAIDAALSWPDAA